MLKNGLVIKIVSFFNFHPRIFGNVEQQACYMPYYAYKVILRRPVVNCIYIILSQSLNLMANIHPEWSLGYYSHSPWLSVVFKPRA